jgi:hypothetical protein
VLAACLPLAWCCVDALVVVPLHMPEPAQLAAAPDAGTAPVVTDTSPDGVLAAQAGRTVPREPERWQKRAPCLEDVEERLFGACYVRAARKPPCPPALFEHGAACFVAVAKSKRPDTSVDEVPW